MEPLDGNAIAGKLYEYFGREMTTEIGTCRYCGARAQLAELVVYGRAPGSVARCPSCGNVLIVLVVVRGRQQVNVDHIILTEGPIAGQ
jgi:hypothetical protein